ncbi:hypothetical protein PILCRDRAFT_2011 [Piloderma croceum F 1598]|uniref:Uncharacterized protein n=1 Tax=Piloderma croceum (strain F 1598) TaxID=765440 RepID=A0A0C3GDB2_PILCF|nr:hypothetical protein PILCRDRAFT_2011 [Piloderma croceum F 1598]
MAAIRDAIVHQKLRLHIISQSKSLDDVDDDNSVKCTDNDRGDLKDGREIARIEVTDSKAGEEENIPMLVIFKKALQVATVRYVHCDVYHSPIPATFLRSAPPITADTKFPARPRSPRAIGTYGMDECSLVVGTSEIGRDVTGVVQAPLNLRSQMDP